LFGIQNEFDLLRLLGSRSFDSLAQALFIYRRVEELGLKDPSAYDSQSCLDCGVHLEEMRKRELEFCIDAVILFQASMEKIPNFILNENPALRAFRKKDGFAEQWHRLINQLPDTVQKEAKSAFSEYNEKVYEGMRNPIVHGRKDGDLERVQKIRAVDVHEGMRNGWKAYICLLNQNSNNQDFSWSTICQGNDVRENLDPNDYPDLNELSCQFHKRYMDELSKKSA